MRDRHLPDVRDCDTAHLSHIETDTPSTRLPKHPPHTCTFVPNLHKSLLAGLWWNTYTPAMPTKLTRVNLALPDEVIAVLDRMGKLTGAGRATFIREWLIEGLPMFEELANAMELASQQNLDAFKVMAQSLEQASNLTGQMSLEMKKTRRAAMRKRNRKPAQEPPADD